MLALVAVLLPGCQASPAAKAKAPASAAPAVADDCAANLHELSGLMLQYYLVHHELPAKLEDAAALADPLQPVKTTCPVSKKPYRYAAEGLVAPGEKRRVIVLDPEPAHDGYRNALVTMPPEANTPLGLWVARLSEAAAQQYHAEP